MSEKMIGLLGLEAKTCISYQVSGDRDKDVPVQEPW